MDTIPEIKDLEKQLVNEKGRWLPWNLGHLGTNIAPLHPYHYGPRTRSLGNIGKSNNCWPL